MREEMFPFNLEALSCFTVSFSSLDSHNKHQQTHGAFLHEAAGGCPILRAGTAVQRSQSLSMGVPLPGSPPQHCSEWAWEAEWGST